LAQSLKMIGPFSSAWTDLPRPSLAHGPACIHLRHSWNRGSVPVVPDGGVRIDLPVFPEGVVLLLVFDPGLMGGRIDGAPTAGRVWGRPPGGPGAKPGRGPLVLARRMFSIAPSWAGEEIGARTSILVPHREQSSGSSSRVRAMSRAQLHWRLRANGSSGSSAGCRDTAGLEGVEGSCGSRSLLARAGLGKGRRPPRVATTLTPGGDRLPGWR